MSVIWTLAHGRSLELGRVGRLMGILNVTPDSFSDGGRYAAHDLALRHARVMIDEGADIIDVGGESTRPGAVTITPAEEQDRVLPVIEALSDTEILISVDTYRVETAEKALALGAHVVNDVLGLRSPGMARMVGRHGAGVVVMHNSRDRRCLPDPVDDQLEVFMKATQVARSNGIRDSAVVFDPGIGFGKDEVVNLRLLAQLERLHEAGRPLLVGTSRKRFLGTLTGREAEQRDIATAATTVLARMAGASLVRVHDVPSNRDAMRVADAVRIER